MLWRSICIIQEEWRFLQFPVDALHHTLLPGKTQLLLGFLHGGTYFFGLRELEKCLGIQKMRAQIQKWDGCCLVCNSPITNPICSRCLEKEVREWLKTDGPEFYNELKSGFYFKSKRGMRCIKCGKGVGVCASCYIREIHEMLFEKNKKLAEEFKEVFNFDSVPVFI